MKLLAFLLTFIIPNNKTSSKTIRIKMMAFLLMFFAINLITVCRLYNSNEKLSITIIIISSVVLIYETALILISRSLTKIGFGIKPINQIIKDGYSVGKDRLKLFIVAMVVVISIALTYQLFTTAINKINEYNNNHKEIVSINYELKTISIYEAKNIWGPYFKQSHLLLSPDEIEYDKDINKNNQTIIPMDKVDEIVFGNNFTGRFIVIKARGKIIKLKIIENGNIPEFVRFISTTAIITVK